MSRTDALIKAAVRALNEHRVLIDSLPNSLTGVQLDIKIDRNSIPSAVHLSPSWHQSMKLQSCGVALDVESYKF